jgi:hypothetical protein
MSDITKCKACGIPTDNTGTKLCDLCWVIDSRLNYLPDKGVAFFISKLHNIKNHRVKKGGKP